MASEVVQVVVRCRPLVSKELSEGSVSSVQILPTAGQVILDSDRKVYTYNAAFQPNGSQSEVYDICGKPLVTKIFQGFNATIMAYGQTGSGKTFTMGTEVASHELDTDPNGLGVIPRVICSIFDEIDARKEMSTVALRCSFLEVYQDSVLDLLNKKSDLHIRTGGDGQTVIPNLTERVATSARQVMEILEHGSATRSKAATKMNDNSSRSHAVFTIHLMITNLDQNDDDVVCSKIHLIDLAGSERLKRTGAEGIQKKEGISINVGLFHLGCVIEQLTTGQKFINYRDHKLTQLLHDSLGGNAFTMFIACISPADSNVDETLNTLKYAEKASKIKNKPVVNRDPLREELMQLKKENKGLKAVITELHAKGTISSGLMQSLTGDSTAMKPPPPPSIATTSTMSVKQTSSSDLRGKRKLERSESDRCEKCSNLGSVKDQLNGKLLECDVLNSQLAALTMAHSMQSVHVATRDEQIERMLQRVEDVQESCNELLDDDNASDSWHTVAQLVVDLYSGLTKLANDEVDKDENEDDGPADSSDNMADIGAAFHEQQLKWSKELERLTREIQERQQAATVADMRSEEAHKFKQEIEDLQTKISALSKEKNELMQQLRSVSTASKISEERRRRLKDLENDLKEKSKQLRDMQKLQKAKADSDKQIHKLLSDVQDLKRSKIKLLNEMRKENLRFQKLKTEQERQINQLKLKEHKIELQKKREKDDYDRQMNVWKQKYQSAVQSVKRLETQNSKRANAQLKLLESAEMNTKVVDDIRNFLSGEVESAVTVAEIRESWNEMKNQRKELSERKQRLESTLRQIESEPSKKMKATGSNRHSVSTDEDKQKIVDQIKLIDNDIKLRTEQMHQSQIFIAQESDDKDRQRWTRFRQLAHARCALKELFDILVRYATEAAQLKGDRDEFRSQKDENEKYLNERSNEIKELQDELDQAYRQQQAKIRFLLKCVGNDKIGADELKQIKLINEEAYIEMEQMQVELKNSEARLVAAEAQLERQSGAVMIAVDEVKTKSKLFGGVKPSESKKAFQPQQQTVNKEKVTSKRQSTTTDSEDVDEVDVKPKKGKRGPMFTVNPQKGMTQLDNQEDESADDDSSLDESGVVDGKEDSFKKDPDYVMTPLMNRRTISRGKMPTIAAAAANNYDNEEGEAKSKRRSNRESNSSCCRCTSGTCSNCACSRFKRNCSDSCSCLSDKCINRQQSSSIDTELSTVTDNRTDLNATYTATVKDKPIPALGFKTEESRPHKRSPYGGGLLGSLPSKRDATLSKFKPLSSSTPINANENSNRISRL